jgi:cell division protease FtsH
LKEKNTKSFERYFDRPNKGPQYTFDIGNDQIFQTKLEKLLQKERFKDFNIAKSNWSDIIISLLPIIILVWIL